MTEVETLPVSSADSVIEGTKDVADGSCTTATTSLEPRRLVTSMDDVGNQSSSREAILRRRDRRGLRLSGFLPSSFSRSDSLMSNCSGVSSSSDCSMATGRCIQEQLVDQCNIIRGRRHFEPLIRWW